MADNVTKRGKMYYLRFCFQGRIHTQSLKVTERSAAIAKAKLLVREIVQGKFDRVFELRSKQGLATLGQVFERYLAADDLRIGSRTRAGNVNYCRKMVCAVMGCQEADQQPVSVLTAGLVRKYQNLVLSSHGGGELEQDTACVTANSAHRQARSLFSKKAMKRAIYEGLNLGDGWSEFAGAEKLKELKRDNYVPPEPALVSRIWRESEELKEADPAVWLAFWLAGMTGLRRKEIVFARWRWIQDGLVRVCFEEDFIPKGRREREFATVPETRERALEVARAAGWDTAPAATILPGTVDGRYEVFRRLGKWMTSKHWTRRQKAHELRKLFATALCRAAGPYAAQMALGHTELETTTRYAARPETQAVNPCPVTLYVLPKAEPPPAAKAG